jgi:two-component system cell cycle sensor histidine kinase/response regulator CckA
MPNTDDLALIAAVADNLPVGVWVARAPDGAFVYANRMFEEIMGLPARDDVARGDYAAPYGIHAPDGALYPNDRMPFERAIAARATVTIDDLVIHRSDGVQVHVRAHARPIFDAGGTITHVVVAFLDITREVQAESARAEGETRLRQAQRMESVGQLAGGIAHDFNNLLTTIKMLASLLATSEPDETKLKLLQQIDRVTDSAVNLTRALLGFARQGKNLVQRVALNDVVRAIAEISRRTIDRRIDVACDLRAAPGEVMGDVSQIEQVLMNLVVNARDAMPEGAGRLVLRTYDRTLDAMFAATHLPLGPGPHVVLEVSDTGVGIDPAIRERVFEPYFTTKTTGAVKGTGLGLATVYGVVQSHGGYVEVADNAPRGTTMRVYLVAASRSERRLTPRSVRPQAMLRRGHGTVLLVEDEPLVRRAALGALSYLGYDVIEAEDGARAVEIFRERHHEIRVVLLDMVMPRMGGRETYLALRECDPRVAVLLTTGFALNEEAQAILDLGVRGFIAKPYDVQALSEAIAQVADDPERG